MRSIAIRLAIVGVIALGGFLFRDRLSGNAGQLSVGDCFDVPAGEDVIDDVQHHPCSDQHEAEVVLVEDYVGGEGATYPSDATWDAFVASKCVPAFNAYTGLDYETDRTLGIGYFTPTQEGWDDGDHEVICYIARIDDGPMTGSVKAGGG